MLAVCVLDPGLGPRRVSTVGQQRRHVYEIASEKALSPLAPHGRPCGSAFDAARS